MKAVTENAAFPESYVVEIDGKIESVYRIYIEALKAGMELKQKFPHSHIKVRDQDAQLTMRLRRRFGCFVRLLTATNRKPIRRLRLRAALASLLVFQTLAN